MCWHFHICFQNTIMLARLLLQLFLPLFQQKKNYNRRIEISKCTSQTFRVVKIILLHWFICNQMFWIKSTVSIIFVAKRIHTKQFNKGTVWRLINSSWIINKSIFEFDICNNLLVYLSNAVGKRTQKCMFQHCEFRCEGKLCEFSMSCGCDFYGYFVVCRKYSLNFMAFYKPLLFKSICTNRSIVFVWISIFNQNVLRFACRFAVIVPENRCNSYILVFFFDCLKMWTKYRSARTEIEWHLKFNTLLEKINKSTVRITNFSWDRIHTDNHTRKLFDVKSIY